MSTLPTVDNRLRILTTHYTAQYQLDVAAEKYVESLVRAAREGREMGSPHDDSMLEVVFDLAYSRPQKVVGRALIQAFRSTPDLATLFHSSVESPDILPWFNVAHIPASS